MQQLINQKSKQCCVVGFTCLHSEDKLTFLLVKSAPFIIASASILCNPLHLHNSSDTGGINRLKAGECFGINTTLKNCSCLFSFFLSLFFPFYILGSADKSAVKVTIN